MAYILNPLQLAMPEFDWAASIGPVDTSSKLFDRGARRPIPKAKIPRRLVVTSMPGFDVMCDIFELDAESIAVSDRCQKLIDSFAPGAVEYVEIEFKIPAKLEPAKSYFYVNVLAHAQALDYAKTPTTAMSEAGQKTVIHPSNGIPEWVMHPRQPSDPAIWLEVDLDAQDCVFSCREGAPFVKNALWNELFREFPGQLTEAQYAYIDER